ncbi:MAG: class I SAM-dependent methyltransferase [Lautropia sp.]
MQIVENRSDEAPPPSEAPEQGAAAGGPAGAPRPEAEPSPPESGPVSDWQRWLASPAGQYVLRWECEALAELVSDMFGYYALQLGLPELDALAANRMPHRILAATAPGGAGAVALDLRVAGYEDLPFEEQSVDLVVLAHQLEFSADPHQVLREVDRVLRPEGRLVVVGLNPLSLWGLRQSLQRGPFGRFVPIDGQLIGVPRVRDWMKLLSFEIDQTRYGCYAPPARTQKWLDRMHFCERAGDRWWPICGAAYIVTAVKRVRAMRLVGPVWRSRSAPKAAPAVAISGRTISGRTYTRGTAEVLPFRRRL